MEKLETISCGHLDDPNLVQDCSYGEQRILLYPNKELVLCQYCYAVVVASIIMQSFDAAVSNAVRRSAVLLRARP